jgi:hypothetical protein
MKKKNIAFWDLHRGAQTVQADALPDPDGEHHVFDSWMAAQRPKAEFESWAKRKAAGC